MWFRFGCIALESLGSPAIGSLLRKHFLCLPTPKYYKQITRLYYLVASCTLSLSILRLLSDYWTIARIYVIFYSNSVYFYFKWVSYSFLTRLNSSIKVYFCLQTYSYYRFSWSYWDCNFLSYSDFYLESFL